MSLTSYLIPPLLMLSAISAHASSYDAIYAFGDSLTDNGVLHTTNPPAPYDNGRFSNGLVAVEYLANSLATPLVDFAFAGATTGLNNPDLVGTPYYATGVLSQVNSYLASTPVADPNGLYFIWAGSNDLLNAVNTSSDPISLQANLNLAINEAIGNLVVEVTALHDKGAEHILVPSLTDLGSTPEVLSQGGSASAIATAAALAFNNALAAALPSYVTQFNTFNFQEQVILNAASYGLSNLTEACVTTTSVCSNPNSYLYWDHLHPTTGIHQMLATGFAAAAVPVPQTFIMMFTGLSLLFGASRKMRRAAV